MLKFIVGTVIIGALCYFGLSNSSSTIVHVAPSQDSLGQVVDEFDFGATLHMGTHEDVDEFLDAIKRKYKGQAVILDLWGTFCGPCLSDFKSSPAMKVKLKELGVNMVYLCAGRSSKPHVWKEVISRDQLIGDHIYLDRAQSEAYMKKFSIPNYPNYILIDKEGNFKQHIISAVADIDIEKFKQQL